MLSDISGKVSIQQVKGKNELVVTAEDPTFEKRNYVAPLIKPIVEDGASVQKGDALYNTFVPPNGSRPMTVRAEFDGKVQITESIGRIELTLIPEDETAERAVYVSSLGNACVKHGALVTQGDVLVKDISVPGSTKNYNLKSELTGRVTMIPTETEVLLAVDAVEGVYEQKSYPVTYGSRLKVQEGDRINAGDVLIEGSINPHDLLRILGPKAVQDYLLKEVLSVYRLQGVAVADKHIEIIVRQMLRKVRVEDNGSTNLLPGSLVDLTRLEEANQQALMEGGRPAYVKRVLLGITKASLATDSFLSAVSFQETNRVLTEAAIKGKIDPLIGLKENVILGKLIPAGTGMRRYKDIEIRENYGF